MVPEMELLCRLRTSCCESSLNSEGMVPEMELVFRERIFSCESLPVSGGMVPEMALLFSQRLYSCESLPISEGMVPEMMLLYSLTYFSCESLLISAGMVPEMELPSRLRCFSSEMSPSCGGIVPDSSLPYRYTVVPVYLPSHSDVPYSPAGQPEEHGTLLSQIVPDASPRPASRRSVSKTRRGAEEEQTAASDVSAVEAEANGSGVNGSAASKVRLEPSTPESADNGPAASLPTSGKSTTEACIMAAALSFAECERLTIKGLSFLSAPSQFLKIATNGGAILASTPHTKLGCPQGPKKENKKKSANPDRSTSCWRVEILRL